MWMTSSWVFYTLMYRADLDYSNLRKDDLVQMLNLIRLYYLKRMGNDGFGRIGIALAIKPALAAKIRNAAFR